jgi:molybdopterin converting factor small subunit
VKLKVKLFGQLAELCAADSVAVAVALPCTTSQLRAEFSRQFTKASEVSFQVAINCSYAVNETLITDQDEVALIPPVCGG